MGPLSKRRNSQESAKSLHPTVQDSVIFVAEADRTGDELTQELVDAWNLYTRVS